MKELRVNKPYQVPQYSKLFFFVVIMMLIGIGVNSSVHAQEIVRETFTAGDTFNNLLVYDSGYAMADVDIVRDAVEHSMDTFSGLFNSPLAEVEVLVYINSGSFSEERGLGLRGSETWVQSQYDFSPDFTFFEAQGEHTFSVTDVCYIQVQDSFGDSLALSFEIAHEVARCFLAVNLSNLDTSYGSSDRWLVESLAEWLAGTAFPENAVTNIRERIAPQELLDIIPRQDTLLGLTSPLAETGYVAVYWWLYLATLEGDALTPPSTDNDVINLILNYPSFSFDEATFHQYLMDELPDTPTLWGDFGVALARDLVPAQPDASDLMDSPIPSDVPITDDVAMDIDFSMRFKSYSTFADVEAIRVSVGELDSASSIQVHVASDDNPYQQVTPDAPIVLCKDEGEIILQSVITRARDEGDATVTVTYEPLEVYEDCEEDESTAPDEGEEADESSCLIGEYRLGNIPAEDFARTFGDLADGSDVSVESMILTIDESFNITHTADDFSVNMALAGTDMEVLVNIDIAVSGSMTFNTVDGNSFSVQSFNYSFDSISATANISGQVMDLSELASDMVSEFGNAVFLPPVRLVCTDFGLDYHVSINGNESVWAYFDREDAGSE